MSVSIKTADHSFMVTPVVNWPQESVMVLSFSAIASLTRLKDVSFAFRSFSSSSKVLPSQAATTTL
jgi:hypothetical protein